MNYLWSKDELTSLFSTLKKHYTIESALLEHNKKWRLNRTCDSVRFIAKKHKISIQDIIKKNPVEIIKREATPEIKKFIKYLNDGKNDLRDLCNLMNASPKRIEELAKEAMEAGYKVTQIQDRIGLDKVTSKNTKVYDIDIKQVKNTFLVGAIADTHAGSKHFMKKELLDYVENAYSLGVRDIFIAGDCVAGYRVYPGQENELTLNGLPDVVAEHQEKEFCSTLPKKAGLKYYIIAGNHCLSFLTRYGFDICERIAKRRDDIQYLGQYNGRVTVNGIKFELHHGEGGIPYAISYKMQRYVDAMVPGTKPQVFILGHFHQTEYNRYRNVHCLQPGCFEGQSSYLLRKGAQPQVGGFVLRISVDEDNSIRSFQPEFFEYFVK